MECRCEETGTTGVGKIAGEGTDWASRIYVFSLVTEALEMGPTRCVVGTRGILGEGWDSPSLNTLVDLTSVTTSTSVQLRGHSIRKDPSWARRVAHNWDVVCVAKNFRRGDADLKRFVRRHGRYWGVVPSGPLDGDRGRVVKGVSHVDPDLAFGLAVWGFGSVQLDPVTRRSPSWIGCRDESHDL